MINNLLFVFGCFIFIGLLILLLSTSERQPTRQQIRNQQKLRRWWRSFKREGEIMLPFILGVIILGFVGYIATQLWNLGSRVPHFGTLGHKIGNVV